MKTKIPPPIIMASCMAVALALSLCFPSPAMLIPFRLLLALVLALLGSIFACHSVFRFWQQQTTISPLSPQETKTLVTDGFYRITRNPMYVGMALGLMAVVIYLATWAALLALPLFVVALNILQIIPEEDMLTRKFGPEYLAYKARVRRWL